jgi:putative hemolysin
VGVQVGVIFEDALTIVEAMIMLNLLKSRYSVRLSRSDADVKAAQHLRSVAFTGAGGAQAPAAYSDADSFDDLCCHVLVEDRKSGTLVCCFRFLDLQTGADIDQSYSAQFYGLDPFKSYHGRMVEMGRFCVHPEWSDADILRIAWGAMTSYVDDNKVEMLFGCSSFEGTEWADHADALAMLKHRHLGPKSLLPKIKAPSVFKFAARLRRKPNAKKAALKMPPLLKTYLMMGGWVSDHAVVDTNLNTMHVFTGVEIKAIPAARKRLLRSVFA